MYRAVSVLNYSNPLGHSSQLSGVAEVKVCVLTESFCIFFLSIMPPHVMLAENHALHSTHKPTRWDLQSFEHNKGTKHIHLNPNPALNIFKPPSMLHNRSNQPKGVDPSGPLSSFDAWKIHFGIALGIHLDHNAIPEWQRMRWRLVIRILDWDFRNIGDSTQGSIILRLQHLLNLLSQ